MTTRIWILVFGLLKWSLPSQAFEWHADGRPEVNRRAIAGLWRLKPVVISSFPKEFTTYPKTTTHPSQEESLPELLLMLKEDGSFHQYEHETDIDNAWISYQKKKQKGIDLKTGVW